MEEIKLIKMFRRDDGMTADVHPDEVENYKTGNFEIVEETKPVKKGKK